jgi:hypothetical protein
MSSMSPLKPQTPHSRRWLLLAGGVAGATIFTAFLTGIIGLLRSTRAATDNWLIVLFRLNYQPLSTPDNALRIVSPLDIALLLLFGLVMAAMYPALSSRNRTWAAIAVLLPFLGVPIFLATETAGRSAVLLAGLIGNILALTSRSISPFTAYVGLVASALLLFLGDFGTAAFSPSAILAAIIAVGYILWMAWLFLISIELLRRGVHAVA